jgi:hypothetical protein
MVVSHFGKGHAQAIARERDLDMIIPKRGFQDRQGPLRRPITSV